MHSLKSALSCKVFIPFYFRIHGSTPHLFSLSGFKAHTCNQNLFQVTRSVLVKAKQEDRSLIAWEGFPFLSSEKVRLSNSRSEPRGGWRRVVGVYQQHVEQKKLCLSTHLHIHPSIHPSWSLHWVEVGAGACPSCRANPREVTSPSLDSTQAQTTILHSRSRLRSV